MKPVASTMTEIDHLDGDEVKFGIGKGQEAWVMRSMADLYSNRELACIREYSTNAYDSNKEKALRDGTEIEPIQVTLPSMMHPYFTVQDFGVGMSETELREIYTQFGDSTKRDSDEFNGMLGFGSKSAIAYTNTFTVTAVKNGIKTVGVVSRREDATGGYLVTMKIVISGMETNERDGVQIQIPVHNWREFEQKAVDFYRFWLPGRVLVNGKEPVWAVGEKIDDNLYYYPHAGASYVVMGNVPYKIANPDALFPKGMNKISFVAYVPVGAVEFTPAREALKYSEHTKDNLHKIIGDFVSKSVDLAKKEIAAAKTHFEAYTVWKKWRMVIGASQVADLTFNGDKLVEHFEIDAIRYDTLRSRYNTDDIDKWSISDMPKTLIVTDFTIELKAAHKKKVRDWLSLKNMDAYYILFTEEDSLKSPWVEPARVVDWQTVKAEAPKPTPKPRVNNVAWGRKAGSFDLITRNGRKYEQDVPSVKPLYYITVQEYNVSRNLSEVLGLFDYDSEVVLVPANRLAKFTRFYPHAKPILSELRAKVVMDGPSLISPEGIEYLRTNWSDRQKLEAMDESRVDDPDIKRLIKIMKNGDKVYLADYKKNYSLAWALGMGHQFKPHAYERSYDAKHMPLTEKYPLSSAFVHYGNKSKNEHVYYYMNAVYKARKEGKNV